MLTQNIFLFLVALTGAVYDWKVRKIPNWLTLGTFGLVLLINICSLNIELIKNCLFGFFAGIGILFIPYLLRAMGAGDVKLLGAIGSLVGFKDVIIIFFYSSVFGLFLGLIWMIFKPGHLKFLITTGQVLPVVDKKQKIPYGVAIFLGTILYIMVKTTGLYNLNLHLPLCQ